MIQEVIMRRPIALVLLTLVGFSTSGCLVNQYSSDPTQRTQELLKQSEDLRAMQDEWQRVWTDSPQPMPPAPNAENAPAPVSSGVKDSLRDELLAILGQTKSVDAFMATVTLLADLPDARSAIPTVIRNAERLGIYGQHALSLPPNSPNSPSLVASQLTDHLKRMALSKAATPSIRIEEKFSFKSDFRTPILPPVRADSPPQCADEPADAQVLRALSPLALKVPFLYEQSRDNIRIVKERVVDRIDPARFFPLVGQAQLHHCHWKCTIYFDETTEGRYPFQYRVTRSRVQVVYIDKDHLHRAPQGTADSGQPDRIDWAAYYKNIGSHWDQTCPGGCCGQIPYAPLAASPTMQWVVPAAPAGPPVRK
jgi:hypothetical protein